MGTFPSSSNSPIDLGSRREIFVDTYLIDALSGARLQMHSPQPDGKTIEFDRPWEGAHAAYVTVIKAGQKYLMFYRGAPVAGADGNVNEFTCYAESRDGIVWTKPELNLFEVMGTKKNNVILANQAPFSHNLTPFVDTRPDVPTDERYKAIAGVDNRSGLAAFVSADGIHWRKWQTEPIFNTDARVFDSQNVAFWSESEQCYVLYYRIFINEIRTVARVTSADFRHWSVPALMEFSSDPPNEQEQLYTNQTQPYYRASHIYIAMPARFMGGRAALTAEQLASLGVEPGSWLGEDTSDTILISSRGGLTYDRTFTDAFIRPGADMGNWVSRCNYCALGIVETGGAEMSVYVQRHHGQESHFLERMTLRLDGFASVSAGHDTGEMRTRSLTFSGDALEINYATSAAGWVRVELQDLRGNPIDGFALGQCREIFGNQVRRIVEWSSGRSLGQLAGKPVRLRFELKEADVYSIRFTND